MRISVILGLIFYIFCSHFVMAQEVRRASFFKENENQIREVYYLKDSNIHVLHGSYISFYMNGRMDRRGLYENGVPNGSWEYYYENGNLKMKGELINGKSFGYWEYFFENGKKKMVGDVDDKARLGEWKFYYQTGEVKSKGSFSNNKRNGVWYYYYEDGTKKGRVDFYENKGKYLGYYSSGVVKSRGLKEKNSNQGKWTFYHENGVKSAEGVFSKGKKSGEWIYYHPNSLMSAKGNYENGTTIGHWEYYFDNGDLQSEGSFVNEMKEGDWNLFYPNGKLKSKSVLTADNGIYKEYYPNGNLKAQGFVENEESVGNWVYYYKDGNIEGQCTFINGTGEYTGFYANGKKKIKGIVTDDKKVGVWEVYNLKGELGGYYKPYYEESDQENPIVPLVRKKNYGVADFLFKGKRFKYFDEGINEFKGIIVAGNPLLPFIGFMPISLEFYLQERLGYEFGFTIKRNPFFKADDRIAINELYTRGSAVSVRQKFYKPDNVFGLWYFGHGIYLENLSHFVNDATTIPNEIISLTASEQRIEWAPMLGYRYLPRTYGKGFTIDMFLGYGIGYRKVNINDNDIDKFIDLRKGEFSRTMHVGLNVGYVFPAEKHGMN